jgi:glycosyltransferase involved in cell wall biosynthesis
MKVLFLYKGSYPDGMAMTRRLHLYAKGLLESGVTPEVAIPDLKRDHINGIHEGIRYFGFKSPGISGNFLINQLRSLLFTFYYLNYCYSITKEYRLILVVGFGWFADLMILLGAHLGKSKVIFEINENPYSPEGGRLDPVWVRKIRRFLMLNITVRIADGFIVISRRLEELIGRYRNKRSLIIRIPILMDDYKENTASGYTDLHPFVLHAGALSETKDGMIAVFEGFAKACLKTPIGLRFILTDRTMRPELRRRIDNIITEYKLNDRIIFKGILSRNELDELRFSSAMAIVNKPSNWQNDYNFPTKLGELLAAGIPVIASDTGEIGRFLRDNENAFLVPPNDSNAIAEKIILILNNHNLASMVGQNGKELARREFHFRNHSAALSDFFIRMIEKV